MTTGYTFMYISGQTIGLKNQKEFFFVPESKQSDQNLSFSLHASSKIFKLTDFI